MQADRQTDRQDILITIVCTTVGELINLIETEILYNMMFIRH